jgi:hypothetical protein
MVTDSISPENRARIERAVREIIEAIGEDPNREGLVETPARIAAMYGEIFGGVGVDPVSELEGGVGAGAFCPGPVATEFGGVAGTGDRFGTPPGMLTAEAAAAEALAQLHAREVVRVPHPIYKATAAFGQWLASIVTPAAVASASV